MSFAGTAQSNITRRLSSDSLWQVFPVDDHYIALRSASRDAPLKEQFTASRMARTRGIAWGTVSVYESSGGRGGPASFVLIVHSQSDTSSRLNLLVLPFNPGVCRSVSSPPSRKHPSSPDHPSSSRTVTTIATCKLGRHLSTIWLLVIRTLYRGRTWLTGRR